MSTERCRRRDRRLGLRRLDHRLAPGGAVPRRPASIRAAIVVLERGRATRHTDFRQSMDIDHLSDVYMLIQGQGAQVVTANAVGGGSNLYLAASLRSPHETFERRDRRPGDGPARRMWPDAISRRALDPYYARAERGLRVSGRPGIRCRSPAACGRRRSPPPATRATACRWRSRRSAASTPSGVTPAASSAPRTRSSPTTSGRPRTRASRCGPTSRSR